MASISGPQGPKGPNHSLLDEGGKPFERRIWELAVECIAQIYMTTEEGSLSDPERIKALASRRLDGRDTARLNRLIEKLWSETADQPSSSKESLIESVYHLAVSRFAERFEIPPMQGPSLMLEQAWLLTRTGGLETETDGSLETVARELEQGLGEDAAYKLRALAQDPNGSAADRQRLAEMVAALVHANPVPVAELQALLDQPSVNHALQRGARTHSTQILGRMNVEVERAIDGEQMARMPGGLTPAKREEFKRHWGMLKAQVEHNSPFKTRNKELTDDERAMLYNLYLSRLERAWGHFRKEEPWRMLETLSDFVEVCEAGWDQQISQLIEQIAGKVPSMLRPLLAARDERRGVLNMQLSRSGLGANVHYERALRQQLNNTLALGFTREELGDAEPGETQSLVGPTARAIMEVVDPRDPEEQARRAREFMQKSWNSLREAEQEQVQQAIRELLQDALERGVEPFFLVAEDLERIRKYQQEVKRTVVGQVSGTDSGERLVRLLPAPPLSVTELPLIAEQIEPLRGAVRSSEWEKFHRLVDDLVKRAELNAFDSAVSGSRRSEILQAMWAGVLGLGSFEQPVFQQLCEDLVPADVSAEVQLVREQEARWLEEAQILEWIDLFSQHGPERVPQEAWQNREFVWAVVKRDFRNLCYALPELKADREFILGVVQEQGCGYAVQYAADALKADQMIMFAALLSAGPWVLATAADDLRANREFMLAACDHNAGALLFAAEALKADREIVLAAVLQDGRELENAAQELQADREIVLAAIRQNGLALAFAAEELRADREIVLAAVRQNGLALQYVPAVLKADEEVVLAAIQKDHNALFYVPEKLKVDRRFMLAAVRLNGAVLAAAGAFKGDREIALEAVQQDPRALGLVAQSLKNDRSFVLNAVQRNGLALRYATPAQKGDHEIVLAAVRQNPAALKWATDLLKTDEEIRRAADR